MKRCIVILREIPESTPVEVSILFTLYVAEKSIQNDHTSKSPK